MTTPDTGTYRMADRLAGGDLAGKLAHYRRNGVSWEAIARLLKADHGIHVAPRTLQTWGVDLGTDERQPSSAA